jgi:hypothetical protein
VRKHPELLGASTSREPVRRDTKTEARQGIGKGASGEPTREGQVAVLAAHSTEG